MKSNNKKVKALVVSMDTRLLSILQNDSSSDSSNVVLEFGLPDQIYGVDVYIYDVDLIGDSSISMSDAISNLKRLSNDKPLILIGSKSVVNSVANDPILVDRIARTMNKPLSYRQLVLAIESSAEVPKNSIPSLIQQPNRPRLVVLSLLIAAFVIIGVTFVQTSKSPLEDLSHEIVKPSLQSHLDANLEVSASAQEIQKLNELAQYAFSEGRLITPENNSVNFYLKQIEDYDSYNPTAHQIRSRLLTDLKVSFKQQRAEQNFTNMNRTLSMIVELEPYNREFVDLLSSLRNSKSNVSDPQQNLKDKAAASAAITVHGPQLETQDQQFASINNANESSWLTSQNRQQTANDTGESTGLNLENQNSQVENIEGAEVFGQPAQKNQESQMSNIHLASIEAQPERIEPVTILKRVEPTYPRVALDLGYEGWVELNYQVDENGNVVNITTSQGDRIKTFEQAAIKAIKKWEFSPSRNLNTGDSLQSESMTATFHFSLD